MEKSFNVSVKAAVFATFTFLTPITISKEVSVEVIPFILLFLILIWLVCFFSILIAIVPFYSFNKNSLTNHQIFKKYFPYFSICCFVGCMAICIYSNFEEFIIIFFTTAFFTAILSWVWFFKDEDYTAEIITPKLLQNETES